MTNNIVKSNPWNNKFFGTNGAGNTWFYDQSTLPGGAWSIKFVNVTGTDNTAVAQGATLNIVTVNHNFW